MNAHEFVAKHGWEAVIEAVENTTKEETAAFESKELYPILGKDESVLGFNVKVYAIPYFEVKCLVNSWRLIEKHGGIDCAIEETGSYYIKPSDWEDLNQAIADYELVESCKEVGNG